MKKRKFIKIAGVVMAGSLIFPLSGCSDSGSGNSNDKKSSDQSENSTPSEEYKLPELGFEFNALEPNIDARTMEIHHGKHHAGYVRKFNAALEGSPFKNKNLIEILHSVTGEDTAIRNNGGGHYNHSLFWKIMTPKGGGLPTANLADAINSTFGSFDKFRELFSTAAKTRFGSGWAWLSLDENKKLFISSTPNQDNPLMSNLVEQKGTPILGLDVWEHAYYLNYQNRRGDYVSNFFNVINWNKVAENLKSIG